jgi:anaerobic ribonucleoside-triphosphate reductase activating protein
VRLQLAGFKPESIVDGPGIRATVYFQGCPHGCPGCHNPETHDPQGGRSFELAAVVKWIALRPNLSGVTFSGGEPFAQVKAAAALADQVAAINLNIVVYSGYTYEVLQKLSVADYHARRLLSAAWLLIDGPYHEQDQDLNLPYRGSRNQRIIDLQSSAFEGKIVEWTC